MPSLLARLRSRRVSLSTTESSTSPTIPSPVYHATSSTSSVPTTPYTSPVDRKIHPNLDSLLEDYSSQLEQELEPIQGSVAEFGTSLKPSFSRRHSVDGATRTRLSRTSDANPGTLDDVDEIMETTASVPEALEDDPSRARRIFDRISYLASPSEWSTFGRNRDHPSPRLGDFGHEIGPTQHPQLENIALSTVTVRRSRSSPRTNASSSVHSESIEASRLSTSTAPEVPSTAPSRKSSFKHPESPGHETRTTDSVSSSRKNQAATMLNKSRPNSPRSDVSLDSPRTFGYPTPPGHNSSFTFGSRSRSSPPPLPPFNHPELTAALRAKSNVMPLASQEESSQGPGPDTIFESKHDRTFPQRSRPGNENSGFASLPSFSLGNLRSRSKSLPQVQQIFASSLAIPAHRSARTIRPRPRARTRTASGRRSSADWSAQEAAFGDEFSWPAQVSREILRLSFGGPTARSHPDARGKHVAVAEQGNTFSPVTYHPSHNLLSEPLGSPFFEAGAVGLNLSDTMEGKEGAPTSTAATSTKNPADGSKNTGKGKASERRSTPSPPKKAVFSSTSVQASANAGPSSSSRPTAVSGPLPASEPPAGRTSRRSTSEPGPSVLQVSATPMRQTASSSSTASKGKRKAEEVEGTPPDQKKEIQRATFSLPPRPHRASANSGSSHAPSSYHRKRPRLSAPTSLTSPPESSAQQPDAGNTGSWASRASSTRPSIHPRPSSRAASRAPSTRSAEKLPRSSMSQVSIPISALISPHAPSVGRSSTFHMSDPRKPPRRQPTGWSLRLRTPGEPGSGSPLHAWCFFIGFVVFPMWWVASFWSTPETRLVGGTDVEKAVTLDDPQVEHDAKSWRLRCRIMSAVSLLTYIPFIVLVVIFVP